MGYGIIDLNIVLGDLGEVKYFDGIYDLYFFLGSGKKMYKYDGMWDFLFRFCCI